jgi:hypothetical protein
MLGSGVQVEPGYLFRKAEIGSGRGVVQVPHSGIAAGDFRKESTPWQAGEGSEADAESQSSEPSSCAGRSCENTFAVVSQTCPGSS